MNFKNTYVLFFILVIHCLYFFVIGEHYTNDHVRYLQYADGLRNSFYFDSHNFWYITYCYFILCIRFFTEELFVILIVQGVIQSISIFLFYIAISKLLKNNLTSFLTIIIIIAFPDFMQWFCYMLPESLYISLLFSLTYFYVSWIVDKNKNNLIAIIMVLLFTTFIKPTAVGIIFAIFVLFSFNLNYKKLGLTLSVLMNTVLLFFGTLFLNKMLTTYGLIEEYNLGEIIYGASIVPDEWNASSMVLKNEDLNVQHLQNKNRQLLNVLQFIWENPMYWFKLFLLKVFYLFVSVRPYWSLMHNTFNLMYLLLVYTLSIAGFASLIKNKVFFILLVGFLVFQMLAIGFTTNDWDGRFLLPVLVVVFVFAASGINRLLNHLSSKLI